MPPLLPHPRRALVSIAPLSPAPAPVQHRGDPCHLLNRRSMKTCALNVAAGGTDTVVHVVPSTVYPPTHRPRPSLCHRRRWCHWIVQHPSGQRITVLLPLPVPPGREKSVRRCPVTQYTVNPHAVVRWTPFHQYLMHLPGTPATLTGHEACVRCVSHDDLRKRKTGETADEMNTIHVSNCVCVCCV